MSLFIRPATLDDAPAVYELLNAIDTIEIGRPETGLNEVEAGLGHPEVRLARDSWPAYESGRLVEARGRGLGGYPLRHSFAAFAGLGRETVGLGVDTRNATGVLKLYEDNGMRVHFAVDTWEGALPV
ncbi:hypothetical protein ACFXKF_11505 [Streptomyces scopuliridis]|uniref:hypothetical protein n=1 Tax=Streptomyces scopuliridis TaxID=452529 RepID=UPI0036AB206F